MNQILVTEKLYITPELKRKKKIYKFYFIISLFVVCILTSLYIYAEYDRNKSAAASEQLLADMNQTLSETKEEDTTIAKDDILLVVLDNLTEDKDQEENIQSNNEEKTNVANANNQAEWKTNAGGYKYKIISTVEIPKINVKYTVLQGETGSLEETESLLKSSPVKYHGCDPNEVGNFCIVGHNYRNSKFFSKVPNLVVGDTVKLTDLTGRTINYEVYDKHTVDPNDTSDTTQLTGGRKELTLITCTNDSKLRVIVRCTEVK